jgi:hypothetical protein
MTSWRIVRIVAGLFILVSLALGVPGSPLFHSPWWLAFTAFVGINLLQSGITQWCLMEQIGGLRCIWSARAAAPPTGWLKSAWARRPLADAAVPT